jgi:hypothetical protein
MDPVSIGLAATAGGAVVSGFGNWLGGKTTQQMDNYKAAIAQVNAQIAEQNANYARYSGEVQAQQEGMKVRYMVGQARAEQGASGFDVSSGSAARVRAGMETVGAQNIQLLRTGAAVKAYGYKVEALQDTASAQLDKYAGANAVVAGDISAVGSILGGASSLSTKWMQGKASGAIPGGSDLGVSGNWPLLGT